MKWAYKFLISTALMGGHNEMAYAPNTQSFDANDKPKTEVYYNNCGRMTMQQAYKNNLASSISEYLENMAPNSWREDTIVINRQNYKARIALGAYIDALDAVSMNIFVPDTTDATPKEKKAILNFTDFFTTDLQFASSQAHEFKHKDTTNEIIKANLGKRYKNGLLLSSFFTPEDVILFNQHNEIASRIATLLYQREQYIKTGDLRVFSHWARKYKKAVEKGIFTPGKMSPAQSELENIYIAKTARDWWVGAESNVNCYVNEKKLKKWFRHGPAKATMRNEIAYKALLDITYSYIKDGQMVCLNYFYNPFSDQSQDKISFADIEQKMADAPWFNWSNTFNKPAVLHDVSPQEKLLDMIPSLRKEETVRLALEQKQKEYKKNPNQNIQPDRQLTLLDSQKIYESRKGLSK